MTVSALMNRWIHGPRILSSEAQHGLSAIIEKQLAPIEESIAALSHESSTHLVRVFDHIQAIEASIQDLYSTIQQHYDYYDALQQIDELKEIFEKKLVPYRALLSSKEKELGQQRTWLDLQFPEITLTNDPDCVEFLIQSRFAYMIAAFKNSPSMGSWNHSILEGKNGETLIKMNGEYQSWKQIRQSVYFDTSQDRVLSRMDKGIAYNYISPDGIVQKDPRPNELYPIGKLGRQEHVVLMDHAKKYWNTNLEIDQGQEKECILQIGTSQQGCLPSNWLTGNCNNFNSTHNFVRLIDKEGNLYSFGIRATKESEDFALANLTSFLAAGYAKVAVPDFDEARLFDGRTVTSIPLTAKRMNDILQFSNEINQSDGVRFSILNQNCNTFVVHIASMAGVEIDTRMTAGEMAVGCLPEIKKIPFIGEGLHEGFSWLAEKISGIVEPIFKAIDNYTPATIKHVFSVIRDAVTFIPRKIATVFVNACLVGLGAATQAEPLKNKKQNNKKFPEFSHTIGSLRDLFIDEKSVMHHSRKLTQWQQKQPSTVIYRYDGSPQICILPPS